MSRTIVSWPVIRCPRQKAQCNIDFLGFYLFASAAGSTGKKGATDCCAKARTNAASCDRFAARPAASGNLIASRQAHVEVCRRDGFRTSDKELRLAITAACRWFVRCTKQPEAKARASLASASITGCVQGASYACEPNRLLSCDLRLHNPPLSTSQSRARASSLSSKRSLRPSMAGDAYIDVGVLCSVSDQKQITLTAGMPCWRAAASDGLIEQAGDLSKVINIFC